LIRSSCHAWRRVLGTFGLGEPERVEAALDQRDKLNKAVDPLRGQASLATAIKISLNFVFLFIFWNLGVLAGDRNARG
jgi:hypothetical protein